MLKFYIVTFFICLFFTPVYAGNSLSGRITDKKGAPLEGTVIEITDLKTGAVADSNGFFKIVSLPKGTYMVEVHLLSFATINQPITINGDTKKDFVLTESVIEKNGVVVTGMSLATEEKRSITPIQSISIAEMHQNASTNVIDAITELPGITALTTGPSVSKPIIRGLGYNRIITLNDGVRQEGQQWGDEHGIEIDDYNVTRIEVLKGPASLAYGSDALAGVVNIISNPDIPEGRVVGNITTNYQTNSGMATIHGDLGGSKKGLSWKVYGTQKNAHDYHNKYDGYVYDTRFMNTDFGATAGINKSWGSSRVTYTSFNEETGIPDGTRDSATGDFIKYTNINGVGVPSLATAADGHSYNMTTPYQHIFHQKLVWDNDFYLGNGGRVGFTLAYQRNTRKEFDDVTTPYVPGLSLELRTITYDLKYHLRMIKGWQVSTGVNGMTQWNYNKGSDWLIPDYDLFDGGAYAMGKKDWNKLTISGGMRYDFRVLQSFPLNKDTGTALNQSVVPVFTPFIDKFSNFSGSLGMSYDVSKNTIIKFNLASGYRSPNIAELSANGVHDGTFRYEIGNSGLHPEHSYQTDLGISWNSNHLLVNASLFNNYITNYTYIRKTDSIPVYNNPGQYNAYVFNQGAANLYGGELFLDYHPSVLEWLHLENTLSYVRGKLIKTVDSNNNLPYMPPFRWLVELKAQRRTWRANLRNIYAKVGLDINSAQNNVFSAYGTETPTPGYTLLDAGIGADITNAHHKTVCNLSIAGKNLTDVAYQNALSRFKYADENLVTGRVGMYNMGRNISFILSVPLDVK